MDTAIKASKGTLIRSCVLAILIEELTSGPNALSYYFNEMLSAAGRKTGWVMVAERLESRDSKLIYLNIQSKSA